jgi:hypothetical protein
MGKIKDFPPSGGSMNQETNAAVYIETKAESKPSVPGWLGEITLMAQHLKQQGVLAAIHERVRLVRGRMGTYEVIDFVAMLLGYASSEERTLEAYAERLRPFGAVVMGLFERAKLPHRTTLSRFLADVEAATVEALRRLFVADLLARPLTTEGVGWLKDRSGQTWQMFDVDGTRQAGRQRAVPQTADLPEVQRRLTKVCRAGYLGRKRGEVVRTRTTVVHSHSHQWLGTFSGSGNGDYRAELKRAVEVVRAYLTAQGVALAQGILRLDGLYGNGAIVEDIAGAGVNYLMRGKDYHRLDLPAVQARLALPPDGQMTHPETGICRTLFDFPALALTSTGPCGRVIVATQPAPSTPSPVGVTRDGVVYELFFTDLPTGGFSAADVVRLYFQRGGFETLLADEDQEQAADRWVSRTPSGQEFWQILSQWLWNLRLELGHHLQPTPLRLTELAPALLPTPPPPVADASPAPVTYGPPHWARPAQMGGFPGEAFQPQPDGTLRCPANHPLYPQERRPERDGRVRLVYAARLAHCRACPLRPDCQGYGADTLKPRRVSAVLWPLDTPPALAVHPLPLPIATGPLLWADWPRCQTRRDWLTLLRSQTVLVTRRPAPIRPEPAPPVPLSRAQRAHWRLNWSQRLQRNAAQQPAARLRLFGIPAPLAAFLALPTA